MRRPALSLAAAVTVTLLASGSPAHAVPATGPATDPACGDTVSGHVTLSQDLVCEAGPGLVLSSGSILDLAGHTLRGPGAGTDATAVVLHGEPSSATVVRGGTVEHWGDGVAADPAELLRAAARIEDVVLRENGTGLESDLGGAQYEVAHSQFLDNDRGIGGAWGSVLTVTDSTFAGNDDAIYSYGGGRIDVAGSMFTGNGTGISCSEQSLRVSGSTFVGNDVAATGWWCKATEISGSVFRGNGTGWTSESDLSRTGPADLLRDNRFTGNVTAVHARETTHLVANTFRRNGTAFLGEADPPDGMFPERFVLEGNTFRQNGDAVVIPTAAADLRANRAVGNSGVGIDAPAATDLGGNVARRNGAEPQCTGVACDTGRDVGGASLSRRPAALP